MNDYNIKCPYCGSENVEGVDIIGSDDCTEHEIYNCCNKECGEYFYVFMTKEVTKVEVSKNKWTNYKTVYEK